MDCFFGFDDHFNFVKTCFPQNPALRVKLHIESGLKAKVRLSIDEAGKVIWKKLMHPSRSSVFNRRILKSVNRLSLPPPVEILVQDPPYVVTILIEP